MAFHIPFNQRHSAPRREPIYIGFDVPAARPRRNFNWWGFNGMWMSFASLMTAGFFSPIPLLISLVGLRRPGKKMAVVGTLTSLVGIGIAVAIVFGSIAAHNHQAQQRKAAKYQKVVQKQVQETQSLLAIASEELIEYRDNNNGELPDDIDANILVLKHVDPWGESLRVDAKADHVVVRSAGPDSRFDTNDDVTTKISGKTEHTALLPVQN